MSMMPFRAAMPENGDEADEGAEREDAAAESRQHAADQGERKAQEDEKREPHRLEVGVKDEEDPEKARERRGPEAGSAPRRWAGVLAEELRVVAVVESQLIAPGASISRATLPRSRPRDVAGDVDPSRRPLALDRVGRGHDVDLGHVPRRHLAAGRGVDEQAAQGRRGRAGPARIAPDDDIEDLLLLVDLADLGPLDERGGRAPDLARGEPEALRRLGSEPDLDLGHQDLRLDLESTTPGMSSMHSATSSAFSRSTSRSGRRCGPRSWRSSP